jgi:uncharacterized membrane protein (Fun14 family)
MHDVLDRFLSRNLKVCCLSLHLPQLSTFFPIYINPTLFHMCQVDCCMKYKVLILIRILLLIYSRYIFKVLWSVKTRMYYVRSHTVYNLTNQPTKWSSVFLEKLIGLRFYGTKMFITFHLPLSRDRWIKSTHSHPF